VYNNEKQKSKSFSFVTFGVLLLINVIVFLVVLVFKGKISMLYIIDALTISTAINFAVGWFMYIYNKNLFSSVTYGFKTFFNSLRGNKNSEDYFEYTRNKKYISRQAIETTFLYVVVQVALLILMYILYKNV